MSVRERLEGELAAVTWRAEDGSFAVGRLRQEGGEERPVVGPIGHLPLGVHLVAEGTWTEHARFGRQFKVDSYLVDNPRTTAGLTAYLASEAVRGIGPELARRTVEHFGLDTLRVLDEQPERLREVEGIGPKRMEEIVAHWERDRADRQATVALRGYGLGAAVTRRILRRYGAEALAVVAQDPFRLASEVPGVAFRTADTIAQAVGITPEDPRRARAAVWYLLEEAEGEGHCFLPEGELLRRARALELPEDVVRAALARLVLERRVVARDAVLPDLRPVYRGPTDRAEARVASRVGGRLEHDPVDEALVRAAEARVGLELNAEQRRAVALGLGARVAVLTGGPGTGKTTIVRVLLQAAQLRRERWALAAPTGRAARRLAESCKHEALTLHRLLEYSMQDFRFHRDSERPLEVDGVLVDEVSMVDLPLMDALLDALPAGARLVLVGDADQLPSVGAGRVLGDLIDSGVVPVVSLSQVYRQAAGSAIVRNAHRVLRGEVPLSAQLDPDPPERPDFFLLPRATPEAVLETLEEVLHRRLPKQGFDRLRDVQVLTPMRRGALGTEELNTRIQSWLNPSGAELRWGGRLFRVGDRVIQVRNDYDADVFNGDTGRVVEVEAAALLVDFDGRLVQRVGEQLETLELAWAISIHKSQGSEYPAVVVLLHSAHHIMLRRSLLYTAMTRARSFCCVIGSSGALQRAVTETAGGERWTGLAERLRAQ